MRAGRYAVAIALTLGIHGLVLSNTDKKDKLTVSTEQGEVALQLKIMTLTKPQLPVKKATVEHIKRPAQPQKTKTANVQPKVKKPIKTSHKKITKPSQKLPIKKIIPNTTTKTGPKPTNKKLTTEAVENTTEKTEETIQKEHKKTLMTETAAQSAKPQLMEKPRFSSKPTPISYPKLARKRGLQGKALIEVWIDDQGKQIKQFILHSTGHKLLDTAALNAIKKWQFSAHSEKSVAAAHRVQIPINFQLK